MTAMKFGTEKPYNFHMCWTQTKADKLNNFKATNMWYTQSACDINNMLKAKGSLKSLANDNTGGKKKLNRRELWDRVAKLCCKVPDPNQKWTIPSNKKNGAAFLTI